MILTFIYTFVGPTRWCDWHHSVLLKANWRDFDLTSVRLSVLRPKVNYMPKILNIVKLICF